MTTQNPLVMIVDDVPQNLQYLADLVQKNGYDFIMVENGAHVMEIAKGERPDLILLDVMMPDIDGYEVCRMLKSDPDTVDIPVIFITAKSDIEEILTGFRAGGVDYITKPYNAVVLEARMNTHVELKRNRDVLKSNIEELTQLNIRLQEEKARADNLASHDFLTGLYNRRYTMGRLKEELSRSVRSGQPIAVVIADIDDFKIFNDHYGHDCGDYILVAISAAIQQALRAHDIVARWGGEEFLFILPNTDASGAMTAAEKVRSKITETFFEYNEQSLFVTMTFGVSSCGCNDSEHHIKQADEALIQGKVAGKNCVVEALCNENI